MGFKDREYEVYVVLGSSAIRPPWVQAAWFAVSRILDPLMETARERPTLRSSQLRLGAGSPNKRAFAFGRIGWDRKSDAKWTHSEDGILVSGEPADFLTSEVWAPSWSICQRELRAPDVYFGISKELLQTGVETGSEANKFNSACLLAVALDSPANANGKAVSAAEALAVLLEAQLRAKTTRQWGYNWGPGASYTNTINDLLVTGLFKPGPRHKCPVDLAMLSGSWVEF